MSQPQGSHRAVPAGGCPAIRRAARSHRTIPPEFLDFLEFAELLEQAETAGSLQHGESDHAAPPGDDQTPESEAAQGKGLESEPPDDAGPPVAAGAPGRAAPDHRFPIPVRRSPEVLRRILPRALVIALLAGGTTAFVAQDKEVELTVDGSSRTLHTFAGDVGTLLGQEGVSNGQHDIIAPSRQAALADGDRVVVRHGRPVTLNLDGRPRRVWTTAGTVDGALRQLGVRAEGAYLSVSRAARIGRSGINFDVRTERTLTVRVDGEHRTLRTNAATLREALRRGGITLGKQDTVSAPLSSFPRDGQSLTVTRISEEKKVEEERIGFDRVRRSDPSLDKGTEVVEQPGRPGVRRVTYHVRTVNGEEQKRRRVESETVREPRKQITKVGTRPEPRPTAQQPKRQQPGRQQPGKQQGGGTEQPGRTSDGLNWAALAQCESGGRPDAVDPSGTYGGLYQFDTRTWQGLGGKGRPQDAPAAEQTRRAKQLYADRGASPWPVCGRKLTQ